MGTRAVSITGRILYKGVDHIQMLSRMSIKLRFPKVVAVPARIISAYRLHALLPVGQLKTTQVPLPQFQQTRTENGGSFRTRDSSEDVLTITHPSYLYYIYPL